MLGPVEVLADDGPVPLGGPRQRAVVAMLALAAPAVVSTDRVVDGLWGESPPDKPLPTLQVFVSKLRKNLAALGGAAFLESRPPGYRLVVDPLETDVGRFADLTARARGAGDAAAALALLDEALGLWRGAALADVREQPFAAAEVVRLEELRLQAEEARVDLALRLGRPDGLVATLEELVHQHPTRERFWAQLMTALYRSDRQADALAAYGRARDRLADELGIDPGEALRQLEVAVLRHDPSLDAPAADAVVLDPRSAPAPAPRGGPGAGAPRRDRSAAPSWWPRWSRGSPAAPACSASPALGGTGKSRVAIEAARVASASDDLDDVVWLPVTESTDAHQLALELALTLGAAPREDPLDALRELDPARRVLVVVDNLESLAEGPALVRSLAETSPALRVLATSRVALRIPGEHEEPVPPLPVPAADAPPAEVAASPAVRLFVARAAAARPGLHPRRPRARRGRARPLPRRRPAGPRARRGPAPADDPRPAAGGAHLQPEAAHHRLQRACPSGSGRWRAPSGGASSGSTTPAGWCATGSRCSSAASPSRRWSRCATTCPTCSRRWPRSSTPGWCGRWRAGWRCGSSRSARCAPTCASGCTSSPTSTCAATCSPRTCATGWSPPPTTSTDPTGCSPSPATTTTRPTSTPRSTAPSTAATPPRRPASRWRASSSGWPADAWSTAGAGSSGCAPCRGTTR